MCQAGFESLLPANQPKSPHAHTFIPFSCLRVHSFLSSLFSECVGTFRENAQIDDVFVCTDEYDVCVTFFV